MTANTHRKLRIFIASPGDVNPERQLLSKVVESLNRGLADRRGLVLELKEWGQVVPDMGRSQAVIFDQLQPESWDILVGILWQRFGAATGAANPANGKPFESGTEEEFQRAYTLWRQTGKPRILFYRCVRSGDGDSNQLARVNAFFDQFDAVNGEHPGLYKAYAEPEDFKDFVREHLEALIDEHAAPAKPAANQFANPFITGKPITDAADFFGRGKQTRFALTRLQTRQSVSIVGERRIGKTSLLHHLLRQAQTLPASRTAFIDLLHPKAHSLAGLLGEIQTKLGVAKPSASLSGFAEQLALLHGQGMKPVVALDELDLFVRLPKEFNQDFCETLRCLGSAEQLVLLTASRLPLKTLHEQGAMVSPLYNIMGTAKLGPFTSDEARAFLTQPSFAGAGFSPLQIQSILDKALNHPLRLQIYGWHLAQANHDGRQDWEAVWEEAEYEIDNML